jgi:hypothetical protein
MNYYKCILNVLRDRTVTKKKQVRGRNFFTSVLLTQYFLLSEVETIEKNKGEMLAELF